MNNKNGHRGLHRPDNRFYFLPEIFGCVLAISQQSIDLAMACYFVQQSRKPRSRDLTKGGDEIVLQIYKLSVHFAYYTLQSSYENVLFT